MELQYYGANCLAINTKQARIVVDDNLAKLGLKAITKPDDISLKTSALVAGEPSRFTIDMPGEYEIAGISIRGTAVRSHMDEDGKKTATVYTVTSGDLNLAVVGHIHPDLTDDEVEEIGRVDVAIVPVGNSGYTLDGVGALQVIKKIEPKVVIPTHYSDKAIKYEVPQIELAEALKGMSLEPNEPLDKYKPKASELTDNTQLVILSRQ